MAPEGANVNDTTGYKTKTWFVFVRNLSILLGLSLPQFDAMGPLGCLNSPL